ncbi:DMT family transporter [Nocardia neocaledoniensis]|uniref:DMT family transporter n=1 Tax=Nocardia neocaledoniensis TaxID=236511 RepID=UPI0024558AB6|nr:DMT family transporter [Nocardia neocaledoniensis]
MTDRPILAIVCALLAALLFAVSSVAQQQAAAGVSRDETLLGTLVRSPRWWAGIVGDIGGYGMQVLALGFGAVLLVQPILVCSLVFALPLAARLNRQRVSGRAATTALVLVLALVLFLVVGDPTAGADTAPLRDWALPLTILLSVVAAATAAGFLRADPAEQALALGVAGGCLFGLAAALTDRVVALFGTGLGAVVTGWQTWALVAAGLLGFALQQRAYQVGPLIASLPAATVTEPLAAAFLGLTALHERLRTDGAGLLVVAACVVVMCVTAVLLCRSQAAMPPEPTAGAR